MLKTFQNNYGSKISYFLNFSKSKLLASLVLGLHWAVFVPFSWGDAALLKRPEVQSFITSMVRQHQFDRKQLTAILTEAKFQPKIIEAMDRPYEKKDWDIYQALFLTNDRLNRGIEFWKANKNALAKAEKEYGVPASLIVAIVGVETYYGKNQGDYRVLDALTTLAFDYPKRAPFFSKELAEYLLLCREQKVSATHYLGSYAGAIGKPQFMPSSYRAYAVDFEGVGRADLRSKDADVISSVANYMHRHGWAYNQPVTEPVSVSSLETKNLVMNSKFPNYLSSQLLKTGVSPLNTTMIPSKPSKAGVIELNTAKGEEYWMAYPNFYVITHYNTSPQYALVVHLLSQQLKQKVA